MKDAVIYTRSASPNKQAIDAQLATCRNYARTHGYNVVAEYIDDGYSGMNFDRPAFTAMNNNSDQWQAIIIYRNDKLSRNCQEFCKYKMTLHNNGKDVVSTAEQLPDATDEIMRTIEAIMSSNQTQKLSRSRTAQRSNI